mmetsp:Transcript_9316/g.13980  ORF Transcript_9316/g.13980 Transcript_9316/m.13980 type:complete len:89 (-) Transcript_9316:1077-1343(-)
MGSPEKKQNFTKSCQQTGERTCEGRVSNGSAYRFFISFNSCTSGLGNDCKYLSRSSFVWELADKVRKPKADGKQNTTSVRGPCWTQPA